VIRDAKVNSETVDAALRRFISTANGPKAAAKLA
jgi:hypothetical protein